MATVQKTTLKRYNGTDWDPVYLANSADISYLGKGFSVAAGEGFTMGQNISASENMADLMATVINNLTAIDKTKIPALANGTSITELDVSKLKGIIARTNLPADVGGKAVEVATEEEKTALTKADVNIGDLVKVTNGKVYSVTAVDPTVTYMELTDSASEIAWSRITSTPTTLTGYGITDAIAATEKVTEAKIENAGKILVLNADGKLDVDITGHVEWANINGAPTSTVAQIDAAVTAATHTNRAVLDLLNVDTDGHLIYDGAALAYKSELDNVALGSLQVVDALPADAASGQLVLEAIA